MARFNVDVSSFIFSFDSFIEGFFFSALNHEPVRT